MEAAQVKRSLNEQFARIAKALAHPRRFELLDLLAQGERPVDALAEATGLPVTTVSSQLQVLREARLVDTRRDGTRVYYRLAGDEVAQALGVLRDLARARLPEVELVEQSFFSPGDDAETVDRAELLARAKRGDVVVIDVRPRLEYDAGHIHGSLSIPFDELERRLDELPAGIEVVAYCRGPYCVLAPQAVRLLRRRGRHARRLDSGMPEWRLAGLPVETTDRAPTSNHANRTP
jgi:DNA-binding transcriptional ArsR family regulator/rhodanese-related sulfurtransferase